MGIFKSFETERLTISPVSIQDAPFILKLFNTPKWIKNIGNRNINTVQEAEDYIRMKMLPPLLKLGFSNYIVTRKSDQQKIGTCGLYDREGIEGIDIGFAFLPEFEKQGYAFESVSKLKRVGLQEFQISELSAITLKDNIGSQNLWNKIGLTFKKMVRMPNDPKELMLFTT